MADRDDPVLRNARREGILIASAWLAATTYCCAYYYLFGSIRPGRDLGRDDVHPVFGIPSWFFWGVMVPWAACGLFTVWFILRVMGEDDLGKDHTAELEEEIREGRSDV